MRCEIIDPFIEIQLKKQNLKSDFWVPKPVYQSPKRAGYDFEKFEQCKCLTVVISAFF